ncbi:MAG: hypothetical protein HRT45_15660 [Bdellovibrionales bacterium]|nr:hypothetical protein [Bdellovibrionales bacterium]
MKANKSNIVFFTTGAMLTLFVMFGQSCGETLVPATTEQTIKKTENNGDYYTGIQDELTKSVSSFSDSLYEQGVAQAPFREPLIVGPNSCERSVDAVCSGGVRRLDFDGCSIGLGSKTLTGFRQVTYSDVTCAYENTGDRFEDTYNVVRTNSFNQQFLKSTENHFDYRGFNIGGGTVYELTANGFRTEVLGKRARLTTPNQGIVFDFSRRTLQPTIFEKLSENSVRFTQIDLEVIDNLNQWTANYRVSNLVLSDQCCHPQSGTVEVEYTGKFNDTGVITYSSCGKADLTIEQKTYDLTLDSCESDD